VEPVEVVDERSCEGEYYLLNNPEEEWVEVDIEDEFENLEEYISDNIDVVCGRRDKPPLLEKICNALNNNIAAGDAGLREDFCDPSSLFPCNCKSPELDDQYTKVWIESIVGERQMKIYRTFDSPLNNEYENEVDFVQGNGLRLSQQRANIDPYLFGRFSGPPEDEVTPCGDCPAYNREWIRESVVNYYHLFFDEYQSGFENSGATQASARDVPVWNGGYYTGYTSFKRFVHSGREFDNGAAKYVKFPRFVDYRLKLSALIYLTGATEAQLKSIDIFFSGFSLYDLLTVQYGIQFLPVDVGSEAAIDSLMLKKNNGEYYNVPVRQENTFFDSLFENSSAIDGITAILDERYLNIYTYWNKSEPDRVEKVRCWNVFTDVAIHRWSNRIHRGARWFRIRKPDDWDENTLLEDGTEKFYILQYIPCASVSQSLLSDGDVKTIETYGRDVTTTQHIRITFFDEDGQILPNPLGIINLPVPIYIQDSEMRLGKITPSMFPGDSRTIYIAVDTPVAVVGWIFNGHNWEGLDNDDTCPEANVFLGYNIMTTITEGQFGFALRAPVPKKIRFTFESMLFNKRVFYRAVCKYCVPSASACNVTPHRYGRFGYWESEAKYPANAELFDSSHLHITGEMLTEGGMDTEDLSAFMEYYPVVEDNIPSANFCQRPIRHYKFPDNAVSPFMLDIAALSGSDSIIYPLGAHIKKSTVRAFLHVAVANGLISGEQERHIVGFEILHGDRSLDRSVVGAGLGYDMYRYQDGSDQDVWFANFPYNDLRENYYIGKSREAPRDYLSHPFGGIGNVNYMFHSPDTSFSRPGLPVECKIEGYQFGSAQGTFQQVEGHPKWVILSTAAISLATKLANIEIGGTLAGTAGKAIGSIIKGFLDNGIMGGLGAAVGSIGEVFGIVTDVYTWSMIRSQWLQTFTGFGTPTNMASYYASAGKYNYFLTDPSEGNRLRGMKVCKYAGAGRHVTAEDDYRLRINAVDRESGVFVSFDRGNVSRPPYMLNYPASVLRYDNSRVLDNCDQTVVDNGTSDYWTREYSSMICSPYMKLKHYVPGQYGSLWSVRWVGTGRMFRIRDAEELGTDATVGALGSDVEGDDCFIYGGDIFLSRFTLKRKYPFFLYNAIDMADMIPFGYRDYRNAGNPVYYVNYDTAEEEISKDGYKFPGRRTDYNLFCRMTDRKYYVKGRFYLFMYGIPSFLVESEINCHFRQAGRELKEDFYPHAGDYAAWTQERRVSIREDNVYRYNPVYSKLKSRMGYRMLPSIYSRAQWDCEARMPNGIIWSSPDVSESSVTDPWLTFKPLDYYEFPTSLGRLIDVRGIESEQLLVRFEHQTRLYNAIDVLKDRLSPELGGGIFSQRGMEYNSTDLGYGGSQSKSMVSCEYGHFWVDLKRGQIFQVDPNGRNMREITSGMVQWMKKHLPHKILRYNIINIDTELPIDYAEINNHFAGLGVTMGWDSRFKRVFVTKRDYVPRVAGAWQGFAPGEGEPKDLSQYRYYGGRFYYGSVDRQYPERNAIRLSDPEYFTDVSFTFAYSCLTGRWISYYSFCPDFYISHHDYFQTGLNDAPDARKQGIWSHLLTNSYQVFYGELCPFIVQAPFRLLPSRILNYVEYGMECRRYQNEHDYAIDRKTGFNKAWLYNQTNNSGELHLVAREKNNTVQDLRYPNLVYPYKEILSTELEGKWRFNDFFNQVRDDLNHIPIWRCDENDIMRELDMRAIKWSGTWNDRLRGEWFMLRLSNDVESRFRMLFQMAMQDSRFRNS
jgi:hypothetical protein